MCKVTLKNIVNVHDCGRLINPALAEAQVHGGMSMAIGYGMSEQLIFDPKTGRPLNNNLLDYKLSTFMDHPHLTAAVRGERRADAPPSARRPSASRPPAPARRPSATRSCNATGVAIDQHAHQPRTSSSQRFSEGGPDSGLRREPHHV